MNIEHVKSQLELNVSLQDIADELQIGVSALRGRLYKAGIKVLDIRKNVATKLCPHCQTVKDKSEFYIRKNGHPEGCCKQCINIISLERRRKLKSEYVIYKGGSCEICGYDKCIAALQFHHTDSTTKEYGLSDNNRNLDSAKEELDKCQLLCANCHAEMHNVY